VLDLSVAQAARFLRRHERFARGLEALVEAGLGYLPIGRPMATLSAGETQRLRLAVGLAGHAGRRLLALIDEPTVGLHGMRGQGSDVDALLQRLELRIESGATVVVIEHAPAVIWRADHVIDLAPCDAVKGVRIEAQGTPEEVAAGDGMTARCLRAWREGTHREGPARPGRRAASDEP
jgi:excinuclease ABC subunit A